MLALLVWIQEEGSPVDLTTLDFSGKLVQMLLVLGALLVALVVALKYLPRFLFGKALQRSMGSGRIEVLERRPLDARSSLYLVRVSGRVYLVGRSEAGLTRLSGEELDLETVEESTAPSFADRLAQAPPARTGVSES